MRSYQIITVCTLAFAIITSGCNLKQREYGKFTQEEIDNMPYATTEDLPVPTGGITISVIGQTLTADEIFSNPRVIEVLKPHADLGIYEIFFKKAKPTVSQVVISKASDVLIYHLARKSASSNIDEQLEGAVEKEINNHVANYGNNYALAEKAFKDMGYSDWKSFREFKKKLIMTQMYMSKQVKKDIPIPHSAMVARYNELKDEYYTWQGMLKMRVIDIQPDKLAAYDIKEGETKIQAAQRKASELSIRAKAGEDFAKLAETNSHGIGKNTGGLWAEVTPGSLNTPYDILEKAAEKMNAGDISLPIKTDGHVFIMKLEEKRIGGTTPFAEVQQRIENELKLIQQRKEYNQIFADIVKQANVKDLDVFTNYCVRRAFDIIRNEK